MIILGAYYGTNMVLYPDFFLDLGYEGVTHIRGINKNTKKLRNNGSGKSLLLSGICEVLVMSSPILEPNDSRAKKDLFSTSTTISLEVDGDIITKKTKGTTVSYEIPTEMGSELVKIDVARDYLWEKFPLSAEEFFTYIYLDSRRTFRLHMGTATERNKLFTRLFRLDNFSEIYAHFSARLSELNFKRRELSTLSEQLHELGEPKDCTESRALHKKAVAKLAVLQDRLRDSRANEANAKSAIEFNKRVDERAALLKNLKVVDGQGILNLVQKAAKDLDREWLGYDNYKSKLAKIDGDIPDEADIEGLKSELAVLERKVKAGVSDVDTQAMAEELGINLKKLPDEMTKVGSRIEVLRHLSQAHESCPACGGGYDPKIVAKFRKELKAAKVEYDKLDTLFKSVELYGTGISRSEYKLVLARLKEVEALLRNFNQHSVVQSLKSRKPELARNHYEVALRMAARLDAVNGYKEKVEVPEVEPFDDLSRRIDIAQDFIIKVKGELMQADYADKHRAGILAKIHSLEQELSDYDVVKALVDAYGTKGIKTLAIAEICNRLQNNLNNFSFSVLPEPIYFTIVIEPNRFDILATRNPGTEFEQTSDVRLLSGGESRAFNLLMLISILPLIPDKLRTNIVVLDEMTANMDSATKHLVYETYIPLLQEQVPHVIVLDTGTTPIDGARELYVVKEGNTSKLVGEE